MELLARPSPVVGFVRGVEAANADYTERAALPEALNSEPFMAGLALHRLAPVGGVLDRLIDTAHR
jgi:hypothetical protein